MEGTEWSSCVVCFRSFSFGDGASVGVESDSERAFKVDFNGVQRVDPLRSFTPSRDLGGDWARGGVSESEKGSLTILSSLDAGFIAPEGRLPLL
jgi:hypothetical protein